MKKRFLAAILCAAMVFVLLPATALAATETEELQAAIDGADATGSLTLVKSYTGAATSVSITKSLILDLNGQSINNITLHIGSATATPAVTVKNGTVNCSGVGNAIYVQSGSLTVESGRIIGDRERETGNGIMINGGSVTIRGGAVEGYTGINYQGGNLTFDCADGKTASITGDKRPGAATTIPPASLDVASGKSVTVASDTQVKVGSDIKTAADLTGRVANGITIERLPPPQSITAPEPLTAAMSNTGAYSGEFILAGYPLPTVDRIIVTCNGQPYANTDEFSWEASSNRVKILTGKLNEVGDYIVTLTNASGSVSCDWQVKIKKFDVPVDVDKPEVATNRYVIEPGDSITLTAKPKDMIEGGYIWWILYDSANIQFDTKDAASLRYTPTEGIICKPRVMRGALQRSHIELDSIEVYLRVTITQGANGRWLRDNTDGLRFVTTGSNSDFSGTSFDGGVTRISLGGSTGMYDVISPATATGGMILTLRPEFLATLPDGPRTLTFLYNNGFNNVSTVIYIGNDAGFDADVPKTGDNSPLALLCGLIALSGAGLAVSTAARRRKRAE